MHYLRRILHTAWSGLTHGRNDACCQHTDRHNYIGIFGASADGVAGAVFRDTAIGCQPGSRQAQCTTGQVRPPVIVRRFIVKSLLFTCNVGRLGLGLGLQLGTGIGFRCNHSWSSIFTPRRNHSSRIRFLRFFENPKKTRLFTFFEAAFKKT